jgi:sarcosine oxidase, subunit gamma
VNAPMKIDPAKPLRTSPLHDALVKLTSQSTVINDMQVALNIGAPTDEREKLKTIALGDLSHLARCGLKGPGARAWLTSIGIDTPPDINQWLPLGKCGLIARLATSEFLIEDGSGQEYSDRVRKELRRGIVGVTPVLRQDAEIALCGPRVNELLLQTCSFNFSALDLALRPIVMTSMIGVSALVIPSTWSVSPFYRIWCDGTYAAYLWEHLEEIAEELGGGPVGLAALYPDTKPE